MIHSKQTRQFTYNTMATMINLLIHFGLNFFLTSYLIENVGSTAYGFFSMANTVVNYALIITAALNSMAARFIGIGYHNHDLNGSNRYFSTVFVGDILFAVIVLVPSGIAILHLDTIINIPPNLVHDVKILFAIVFANMLCNIVFSVFGCVYTIKNRLDISSLIQLLSNIVKSLILIVLYSRFVPSIVYLGTATLIATIITTFSNVIWTKRLIPEIELHLHYAKLTAIKEIVASGIWNSINQLSITLLNGLDLVIANLMISAESMGYLSVASTIPGVITTFISTLSNLFTPRFLEFYSHNDFERLYGEVKNSIRFMTVITCMPISFLIAFGVPFLKLWVPNTDIRTVYVLSILILLPQLTGGAINSMNYLYTVANKVKWQAAVLLIAGVTNVMLVFFMLKFTSLGVYAIAGVSAVIGFARNFLFNAPYAAHCIHKRKTVFWPDMFKAISCLAFCSVVGFLVNHTITLDSWIKLIVVGGFTTIVTGSIVAIIVLDKDQKKLVRLWLKSILGGGIQ